MNESMESAPAPWARAVTDLILGALSGTKSLARELNGGRIRSSQHFELADNSNLTVWGGGVGRELTNGSMAGGVDVRMVRGPWSVRWLSLRGIDRPPVVGEPALLVSYLFDGLGSGPQEFELLQVPASDNETWMHADYPSLSHFESAFSGLMRVRSSGYVIGSSVVAIAAAESMGVATRFVWEGSEFPIEIRDYLSATGRHFEYIARSLEEAIQIGPQPPPELDLNAMVESFRRGASIGLPGGGWPQAVLPDVNDWCELLENGRLDEEAAAAEYVDRLREFGETTAPQEGLADLARELIDLRFWWAPGASLGTIPQKFRGIDEAVMSADVDEVVRSVARVKEGLSVRGYGVPPLSGTAVSIIVTLDRPRSDCVEVSFHRGEDMIFGVPRAQIPVGKTALLDLDVVLPTGWSCDAFTQMDARIGFGDGSFNRVGIQWSSHMPSVDVLNRIGSVDGWDV